MDKVKKRTPSVYSSMSKILGELDRRREEGSTRALMANLRNSIGKDFSQTVAVWPIMFQYLPAEYLSKNGIVTKSERAILSALQLYAIYQQGIRDSVLIDREGDNHQNFAYSLKRIRDVDDSVALDRRFNVLITSSTYEEFFHHLKQMIQLLKAGTKAVNIEKINFASLAADLYEIQKADGREKVRLRWAQNYYYQENHSKVEGESSNEQ